jgi:cell division topological specificity factor
MKLFNWPRHGSATIARERLQILLAHERAARSHQPDLLDLLHEEILAVVRRHVAFEPDAIQIKLYHGKSESTLAIDIEIPNGPQAASMLPQYAQSPFDAGRRDNRSGMNQGVA